jgi:DMSO reductase anchor subunit
MARIYMLPAVAEWNSAATPAAFLGSALVLGSMTAAVLLRKGLALAGAEASLGTSAGAERTALASIGLGYVLALLFAPGFGLLARTVRERVYPPRPGLRSFFAGRMIVLSLALAIWALALISGDPGTVRMWLALALAFGSEVVGRLLFYSIPAGL